MAIIYEEATRQFHLSNNEISYIMRIMPNEQLGQIYFGKRVSDIGNTEKYFETIYRDMSPVVSQDDISFSLDQVKQECSVFGKGDLRQTAMAFTFSSGSHVTDFRYVSHEIFEGKKALPEMPAIVADRRKAAQSLWITLKDKHSQLELTLQYTIMADEGMIIRSFSILNNGSDNVELDSALSVNLDLPDSNYDAIMLTGAWCRERHVERFPLHRGIQQAYSLRGHSSHQYNPFLALIRPDGGEHQGEVIGMSLIYSGNFLGQVEVDNYDTTRILMGIHPTGFAWTLKEKESFQTPEVVIVYSDQGLNKMSQTYHRVFNNHLIRETWRKRERPILINNWEATYMDFNESQLIAIAESAKELGVDLFVLDDGWFGKRNSPQSSLGDWWPNPSKFPDGLERLSKRIHELGLQFGLWFEPEMVSIESDLYRRHPDWLLSHPSMTRSPGRYQYYLDLSKKEVVDYLYKKISLIIEGANLSYIKWDLNRSMSEVYSQGRLPDEQGMVYHKTVLGMYRLHDLLLQKFPDLLIESCASGGARFDPGMLYYAPQGWVSDNTDAVDRLKIQAGTSLVYPLSSMGTHVSAVPNHQTNRLSSLKFRGDVATFGTFGYELDSTLLTNSEQKEIKAQISFVKSIQPLLFDGTFYRLESPFSGNRTVWLVVSEDQTEGVIGIYRTLNQVNQGISMIKLKGLKESTCYELTCENYRERFYGSELMTIGLPVSGLFQESDFLSTIITMVEC